MTSTYVNKKRLAYKKIKLAFIRFQEHYYSNEIKFQLIKISFFKMPVYSNLIK